MSSAAEETGVAGDWTSLDGSQQRVAVEVLRHGPLPRAELARRLGLSPGSLTRLARPLVDSGLLVEGTSDVHARTGRPSLPLDVRPSSRRFIGVKITGDALFAVVTDLRAAVVAEHETPLPGRAPATVVDAVAGVVARLREEHGEMAGLGIGIGGRVAERRDVTSAPFLGWQDTVPLAQRLLAATGLPTVVENDVRALTVAEHWFGAGRGLHSLAVVTIGVGVGCGIVVHDRLVEGAHGAGGSIGHRSLPGWAICAEGHRGCATAVLASGAITAAVGQALGRPVTYDEVLELARAGQPAARRAVTDAGRALGLLVAGIADLVDPELVILTGDGIGAVEIARGELDAALQESQDPMGPPVRVDVRPFPFTEWARGAAAVAVQAHVLGPAAPA
ncbi:ROK family transcriptional regulator [Pseudonocardia xinjiangensis]|uniref:ROK family transcriptional regulator n=1 Tax=Pseudonocardia xinjiangensis TaxID=75289 RepID=A0ABX1RMJ5_9PSEU|nr:ROK family transcriptional regulator [Pseudonocardia xinjiangensis]NMH80483.1 ROK family transcriptional regulator [Pseudonocardia xinjiangensis]